MSSSVVSGLQRVHHLVSGRQARIGVVAALVVVVLDVEVRQLRVFDSEGAAAVVDVLPVEGQLGSLGRDDIRELDENLKGVVLGEGHNLQDLSNAAEDLVDDIEGDWVDHVLDDDPENCV